MYSSGHPAWREDILGAPYEAHTIQLQPDAEGPVAATLVRAHSATPHAERPAVLYIHGYNDYFFQSHHAAEWLDRGYDFFAIDLRKYGRSLLPGQTRYYCDTLGEYFAELDIALNLMRREVPGRKIVILGHSTGGLIAPLWLASREQRGLDGVTALILNSAFLEIQGGWVNQVPATYLFEVLGRVMPHQRAKPPSHGVYGRSLHREYGGEWEFDTALKPISGHAPVIGWLRAVRRGQLRLQRGLGLDLPVLACTSHTSDPTGYSGTGPQEFDGVLELPAIVWPISRIGADTTHVVVTGGSHDLSLAVKPAREFFVREMFAWLGSRGLPAARIAPNTPTTATA